MLPMLLLMNGAGSTSGTPDTANNPFAAMGGGGMGQMMQFMMMQKLMGGNSNFGSSKDQSRRDSEVLPRRRPNFPIDFNN